MTTPCHIYNNVALIMSLTTLFRLITPFKTIHERPPRIHVFVSYGYVAPVGTTLLVNNTPFTSSFKLHAAPCSVSQQSFSSYPCGFPSIDSNSLGQNSSFPIKKSSFSKIPNTSVTQMPFASIQNVSMSTCFQKSVPKSHADHFDGGWSNELDEMVLSSTFDNAPMTPSEMIFHLQSLLTGEAKAWSTGMVAMVNYTLQHFIAFKKLLETENEL